jgi:Tfp pilus assembly protein PilO
MANWTQKKLLLTIGGTSLALCLLAGGGIYYTQGLIEEVDARVADKQKAIEDADRKIATIPALEKAVIILRENLDEYVKILPNDAELSNFLRMLNQSNRQAGITKSNSLTGKNRREAKGERFTAIEYTYDIEATLWQCMKFMNLIENFERFVSITEFQVTSGDRGRGDDTRDGAVVHKVRLTMQTYKYNGLADGKEAKIPDYDKQKELLTEEIWNNMRAIRLDKYSFRGDHGRRDVLIDPRDRGGIDLKGPSQAEQRTILERNIAELTRLREMQQKIKRQDTTLFEQYTLEKNLKEGIDKLTAAIEADAPQLVNLGYRLRWAREVVTPFEDLRGQVAAAAKEDAGKRDPYLAEKDMKQLVADLEADCTTGQLEQAKNRYESISGRINVPANDPRHEIAVQAKKWHHMASTALDFKSLELKVQGVVVNRAGRSGVLLNGETYEEGEYVSDDLLVKAVEEEQIWFVFRGLTLVRTM